MAKVIAYLYVFLWFRFTFPRYRFDQLMRLGWRFLIPLALVNVIGVGVAIVLAAANWAGAPFLSMFPDVPGHARRGDVGWQRRCKTPVTAVQPADGE